jgi:hypothetical protein
MAAGIDLAQLKRLLDEDGEINIPEVVVDTAAESAQGVDDDSPR